MIPEAFLEGDQEWCESTCSLSHLYDCSQRLQGPDRVLLDLLKEGLSDRSSCYLDDNLHQARRFAAAAVERLWSILEQEAGKVRDQEECLGHLKHLEMMDHLKILYAWFEDCQI